MMVLIAFVYFTMDQAFKQNLLRASQDDLLAIRRAYVAGLPRRKGVHEAKEMIEDHQIFAVVLIALFKTRTVMPTMQIRCVKDP